MTFKDPILEYLGFKQLTWGEENEALYVCDDMYIYRENNTYSIIDFND